ncbi:transposase [Nocardia sp. CA-107356]|uniref:transposase n=1 Tax=Nocardia sp. CA-107356 TaxID=3239972 RepID=UPI003D8C1BD1
MLASIFRALECAFDYSTRSALILLTGFQTPADLRAAGRDDVRIHLLEQGAWAKGIAIMTDKAWPLPPSRPSPCPVTAPLIARLARQLLDLDREIKDLDKQVTERFGEHPHAGAITSVDGLGSILGAQLLADADDDLRTVFRSAGRLAAYAGLAPVPATPARSRETCTPQAIPPRYAQSLLHGCGVEHSPRRRPSRAFCRKKRAEGKAHSKHSSRWPPDRRHLGTRM